ncbi:MAG: hypothetical protein LIP23_08660, partial [Planctomycetes bacterium]|nr:hypothetical protein [Planctomycetota bacterium]
LGISDSYKPDETPPPEREESEPQPADSKTGGRRVLAVNPRGLAGTWIRFIDGEAVCEYQVSYDTRSKSLAMIETVVDSDNSQSLGAISDIVYTGKEWAFTSTVDDESGRIHLLRKNRDTYFRSTDPEKEIWRRKE